MKQKQLLNDEFYSILTYYLRVWDLYKFEPRRKYVEELVDTNDSDAASDDNDDSNDDSVAQPFTSEPSANEPVIAVADGKIALVRIILS